MRAAAPFLADDLGELDERLYARARRVVPMWDVFKGDTAPHVIGLRHDVDDNQGSFQTALRMAEWEFEHGYSSTYFLLHDSHYWGEEMLVEVPRLEELGHEVGIHVNAIAEAFRQERVPEAILADALSELRSSGVRVVGCVAHGDNLCHQIGFVNDEMFSESPRPECGRPDRLLRVRGKTLLPDESKGLAYRLEPTSRRAYGLEYDASWISRGDYLSDSSGRWSQPFERVVASFGDRGQLHVLVHPDWWGEALVPALA